MPAALTTNLTELLTWKCSLNTLSVNLFEFITTRRSKDSLPN